MTSDTTVKKTRSKLPQTFWVANTMEIFERLAWYGFFGVSSLYITGSVTEGALGFSDEDRGMLQGIIPFLLYLFPVFFGALADRYGYKKTFIVAYSIMVPAYFLLGEFTSFGGFFMAFLFVAVGAAIFKPVVVGTVARTTDETNSSMGFGIFYMMVNIGGFVGPVVAGIVRVSFGWDWVFYASSFWIALNFIWVLVFYKEPTTEAGSSQARSLKSVLGGIVEVFGNARFFIIVLGLIIVIMVGGKTITWGIMGLIVIGWLILNLVIDIPLSKRETRIGKVPEILQPIKLHNWRFGLYLLILSGFWTSFNQIFITMPVYLRDFVETNDIINLAQTIFGSGIVGAIAAVNMDVIVKFLQETVASLGNSAMPNEILNELVIKLRELKVAVSPEELKNVLVNLRDAGGIENQMALKESAKLLISKGQQINPEYIINIDAGAIVFFQVLVSFIVARFKPFSTMVVGVIISAIGIGASAFLHSGIPVVIAIAVFAFGEMMASPKSQEYVGRIAPPKKVAMYMGYYFISIALGNIFGGRLSGELYEYFGAQLRQPEYMWLIFGGIGILTAIALILFDKLALRKGDEMKNDTID